MLDEHEIAAAPNFERLDSGVSRSVPAAAAQTFGAKKLIFVGSNHVLKSADSTWRCFYGSNRHGPGA
jgi:hypothetical protein